MELSDIYENLCMYDSRNPLYDPIEDIDWPARTNCYCGSCINGRDKLALEILRLKAVLDN